MTQPGRIIIVAMTRDRVIGRCGRIPWRLPEDLQLFRELTTGHTVVMGRETFESIGRPLPGRRNLVVSRSLAPREGVEICTSFEEALLKVSNIKGKVFFIGGVEIYAKALPVVDTLVVSWVENAYPGDTLFPVYDATEWTAVRTEQYAGFTRVWYRRSGTRNEVEGAGCWEGERNEWPT